MFLCEQVDHSRPRLLLSDELVRAGTLLSVVPKAESKTHFFFLIGSRAFADLCLQTHQFPPYLCAQVPTLSFSLCFCFISTLSLCLNEFSLFQYLPLSPSPSFCLSSVSLLITKQFMLFAIVRTEPDLVSSL